MLLESFAYEPSASHSRQTDVFPETVCFEAAAHCSTEHDGKQPRPGAFHLT